MILKLDHQQGLPLHKQLFDQIVHHILSGKWAAGSRLPSEPELSRTLNISRNTIRQALNRLEVEGLIVKVPGKGSFVREASPEANNFIGFVVSDYFQDTTLRLFLSAEESARSYGYRLVCCNTNQSPAVENETLRQLLEDGVRGVLIWPNVETRAPSMLHDIVEHDRVPVVLLDRGVKGVKADVVTSRNEAGGTAIATHLIDLGHRRIAMVSKPSLWSLSTLGDRYQGIVRAVREAGLPVLDPVILPVEPGEGPEELNTEGPSDAEIEALRSVLVTDEPPTAMIAGNSEVAARVLQIVKMLGHRVPEDVSVAGFDNPAFAGLLDPPLTTVAQDLLAFGIGAFQMLDERIRGFSGPPRVQRHPMELRVRKSTAPPPAGAA